MNRIFQKFLQSVIDLSSVRARCCEDNTHDIDMNPDAEAPIPEWKVYFDGNFWEPSGKDRAGTEIRLDKQFEWAGHHWIIPAAYSCNKGLVLDFCMCTLAEDIREFMKKWDLSLWRFSLCSGMKQIPVFFWQSIWPAVRKIGDKAFGIPEGKRKKEVS